MPNEHCNMELIMNGGESYLCHLALGHVGLHEWINPENYLNEVRIQWGPRGQVKESE